MGYYVRWHQIGTQNYGGARAGSYEEAEIILKRWGRELEDQGFTTDESDGGPGYLLRGIGQDAYRIQIEEAWDH